MDQIDGVSPMNRTQLLIFSITITCITGLSVQSVEGQELGTLGDLIRNRDKRPSDIEFSNLLLTQAEELIESDELTDNELTEELGRDAFRSPDFDEAAPDDGQEKSSEQSSRDRFADERLQLLRKPIGEIRIGDPLQDQRVPEDKAARYAPPGAPYLVTALGDGPELPNRYTICFKHRPLYYEQPNLERCGNVCCCGYLQNAISGMQFVANTIKLPYRLGKQHPHCLVPTRGDCKTCQTMPVDLNPFPLSCHGLLTESAAAAGFTFLLL